MKATIDELQTFITIVEAGSIVDASVQLSQTTSAVSRSLKRLEKKLNITLLERTTRMLQLTEAGELFLQYAREIIDKLMEAEDAVLQSDIDLSGKIRIDAATPVVLHILTPLIVEFTELYPDITIELSNHEHIIDLLKEKVDLAIRVGNLEDSSLHAKLLMQSQLHIVASADYIEKHGMPKDIKELKKHKCIGFSQLIKLNRWPIYDGDELYMMTPQMSSTNGEVIRSLLLQGAGIGCLSEFLIAKDLEAGKLVKILNDQTEIQKQNIYAV
ncbi:LysR family transcriptional regulator, partial [Wohlfahrtiimonas larvae]